MTPTTAASPATPPLPPQRTEANFTFVERAVVAGAPALAWVAVGTPFDVVRVRLQTARASALRSPWRVLGDTVRMEGVAALWKGAVPQLLLCMPCSLCTFITYDYLRPRDEDRHQPGFLWGVATAAAGAGVLNSFLQQPMDIWRTRLQLTGAAVKQFGPGTTPDANLISLASRGLLLRGFECTMFRSVFGGAIFFSLHEHMLHELEQVVPFKPLRVGLSGGLSGIAFGVATQPIDVVRTRVMASDSATVLEVTRALFREAGLAGFYRGLTVTVLKSVPVNAAGFLARAAVQGWFLGQGTAEQRARASPSTSKHLQSTTLLR